MPAQDQVTLLGFNDNIFTLTRKPTDPAERVKAVDRLAPWGSTALYDVHPARRRACWAGRPAARRSSSSPTARIRAATRRSTTSSGALQSSDVTLYMIGQGRGVTMEPLKRVMERLSQPTGGRALFTDSLDELHAAFAELLDELSNQYLLGYQSTNTKRDDAWRRDQGRRRRPSRGACAPGIPRDGRKVRSDLPRPQRIGLDSRQRPQRIRHGSRRIGCGRERALAASLVVPCLLGASLCVLDAEQTRRNRNPVFSVVEVTSLDVSVVDDWAGRSKDLATADFKVRIDGTPRRLVSAEWIPSPAGGRPPAPPDGYSTNESATGGRLIVLGVDQPNIRFGGARQSRAPRSGCCRRRWVGPDLVVRLPGTALSITGRVTSDGAPVARATVRLAPEVGGPTPARRSAAPMAASRSVVSARAAIGSRRAPRAVPHRLRRRGLPRAPPTRSRSCSRPRGPARGV